MVIEISNSVSVEAFAGMVQRDVERIFSGQIRKIAIDSMQKVIRRQVYDMHNSGTYNRTGQFLNALEIKNFHIGGGRGEFEIVIDPRKLSVVKTGSWFAHGNFKGESRTDMMDSYLNDGHSLPGGKRYMASHYWELGLPDLDRACMDAMYHGLVAAGYDVSYG